MNSEKIQGEKAAQLTLPLAETGISLSLDAYKGRAVLVIFLSHAA
jgi:hypothetical protein